MKALGCHVMLCVQVGGEGIGGVVSMRNDCWPFHQYDVNSV